MPTVFIPHGGGPCFFMDPPYRDLWDGMAAHLRGIDAAIGRRPTALVVISGHWEAPVPTVNAAAHPPMLFDYYGFPEHTYRLSYPAPGSPELAARIRRLLEDAGMRSGEDDERGFDHGVFVPLLLVYPKADLPIVQLSLQKGLDPAAHLALGKALAPLRDDGVLIVGSGMSYHNLRGFFENSADADSRKFDAWLTDAVETQDVAARNRKLEQWSQAPAARASHPREEHLLPLMVVAGAAAEDTGHRIFTDHVMDAQISAYQFGGV